MLHVSMFLFFAKHVKYACQHQHLRTYCISVCIRNQLFEMFSSQQHNGINMKKKSEYILIFTYWNKNIIIFYILLNIIAQLVLKTKTNILKTLYKYCRAILTLSINYMVMNIYNNHNQHATNHYKTKMMTRLLN